MPWWLWMVAGFALSVLELQLPVNFYLLGFGAGAVTVGLLEGFVWNAPAWAEWLLFTAFSLVAVFVAQRSSKKTGQVPWQRERELDNLVNEIAIPLEDIAGGSTGKAELRGSQWIARNAGSSTLARGERCRVERVEGLTLSLRRE